MTEGYRYTACGLDYVYLQNGFEVRETKHGTSVAIKDARGLHETIARSIISAPQRLRGQEVRFLRAQLKLSQDGLARFLRTKRGSIARWEAEPEKPIPGPADSALRLCYALKSNGHAIAERIVDLLADIDELEHRISVIRETSFRDTDEGWRAQPLAA